MYSLIHVWWHWLCMSAQSFLMSMACPLWLLCNWCGSCLPEMPDVVCIAWSLLYCSEPHYRYKVAFATCMQVCQGDRMLPSIKAYRQQVLKADHIERSKNEESSTGVLRQKLCWMQECSTPNGTTTALCTVLEWKLCFLQYSCISLQMQQLTAKSLLLQCALLLICTYTCRLSNRQVCSLSCRALAVCMQRRPWPKPWFYSLVVDWLDEQILTGGNWHEEAINFMCCNCLAFQLHDALAQSSSCNRGWIPSKGKDALGKRGQLLKVIVAWSCVVWSRVSLLTACA